MPTEPLPIAADGMTNEPARFDGELRLTLLESAEQSLESAEQSSETQLRCRTCGDVIGVYEPLVTGEDSHARITSRAAEPGLSPTEDHHHRACFGELNGSPPSP